LILNLIIICVFFIKIRQFDKTFEYTKYWKALIKNLIFFGVIMNIFT
jgi:hypothetical protein